MIKRILVGLCGTPYAPLSSSRRRTAAQHGADLTGVTGRCRLGRMARSTGASASGGCASFV
jgi:hypothetical protein